MSSTSALPLLPGPLQPEFVVPVKVPSMVQLYGHPPTCLLSRKLSKLDESDMQDTAGEAGTNS